jgi:hypothetical protein
LFSKKEDRVVAVLAGMPRGPLDYEALAREHALPETWSSPAVIQDVFTADGVVVRRAGLSSTSSTGEEIVGSAADAADAESSPGARAYFELLERVSTVDWLGQPRAECDLLTLAGESAGSVPWKDIVPESPEPARWRYSRSNGIALHTDWERASSRAFWELCERDRILRAWYGETVPERIAFDVETTPLAPARSYEWMACSFPEPESTRFSHGVHVHALFGIPKGKDTPLVFGFGARPSFHEALLAATREATQLLAFLWGEPLSATDPPLAPTPTFHLETLQRHDRHDTLRRWVEEGHARYRREPGMREPHDRRVFFVDLTPSWLKGLRVSKASCAEALPLAFGDGPLGAHLPPELRIHPIA